MRMSQLVGRRIKETPKDAQTPSHIFLLRGGYARMVSAGIYSLLPLGRRVIRKIEAIIRDEMNAIDGQEVLLPVVLPGELWQESGRYDSVGPELLRFVDRNDKAMLLGMTHEEAVVHLLRTEVNSYKQLPVMVYQVQTKYRDEARPRAGLIRVREFTMKDGYSFHRSQECLEHYYKRCHHAYERIFRRLGMREVLSIESDPGMMGGSVSHEFMAVAACGEDTLFVSEDGQYKANKEIATTALQYTQETPKLLEKVHTPNQRTIDELATFLNIEPQQTGKAVFYALADGSLVFAVIRGDLEVNEVKLKNYLKTTTLDFATDEQITAIGSLPGYASPVNIDPNNVRIVFDPSARHSSNLVVGANEKDYHLRNFNFDRDMGELSGIVEVVDIATARAGDPCPVTGTPLVLKRGIEVGNIFQLGTKYSDAMDCSYLDENGKRHSMVMGCYGIGVGRAMAAVIEQAHDQYGPIWPITIAPYHVHLCALNGKKPEVANAAESLYNELIEADIEVLFDDRNEKAGFMFNDADLIGIPFRVIVSPKTVAVQQAELKSRDGARVEHISLADVSAILQREIAAAFETVSEM